MRAKNHRKSALWISLWLGLTLPCGTWSHGALTGDADLCTLAVGPFKMHFSGYQPTASGNQEFCEDIPATGQTIIVLESMDDQLREMEIAARVITESDGITELDQPFRSNARGSITLMHTFPQQGRFVGLVTVRDDETEYVAEFPFSVGLPAAESDASSPTAGSPLLIGLLVGAAVLVAIVFFARARSRATNA